MSCTNWDWIGIQYIIELNGWSRKFPVYFFFLGWVWEMKICWVDFNPWSIFFFKLTLYTFIMQKNCTQMKPQVVIIQMLTLWISCCCVATTPQHHSLHHLLHHLHIPYHLPLTVPNHPPNWDLAFGPTLQQAGLREGEEVEGSCLMTQLWWRLWQDDRVWRFTCLMSISEMLVGN